MNNNNDIHTIEQTPTANSNNFGDENENENDDNNNSSFPNDNNNSSFPNSNFISQNQFNLTPNQYNVSQSEVIYTQNDDDDILTPNINNPNIDTPKDATSNTNQISDNESQLTSKSAPTTKSKKRKIKYANSQNSINNDKGIIYHYQNQEV